MHLLGKAAAAPSADENIEKSSAEKLSRPRTTAARGSFLLEGFILRVCVALQLW